MYDYEYIRYIAEQDRIRRERRLAFFKVMRRRIIAALRQISSLMRGTSLQGEWRTAIPQRQIENLMG